jgi:hypothetical protein
MPRGASQKREREYEKLKSRFKSEGRYKGREEEVASRIVNKQRSQYGETKAEKKKDQEGRSPDRNLPVRNYQHLTIPQISDRMERLTRSQLRQIEEYEKRHKNRKGVLQEIRKARTG